MTELPKKEAASGPNDKPSEKPTEKPSEKLSEKTDKGEKSQNIQDNFLNNARRDRALVTIFLMGGAKLTGKIRSFDKYSLVLDSNRQDHLIFKHAISTVVQASPRPARPSGPPSPAGRPVEA